MTRDKVGLWGLIALVVGSMIGSGLFDLPRGLAQLSAQGPLIIAWGITLVGMGCMALVFKELSVRKPHLDAGVYAYARAGFGDYIGFNSAWGYWISAWMGNIAFLMILSATFSTFFEAFGDGTNVFSIVFNSIVIWVLAFLCASGIKSVSSINLVTTIVKLLGIGAFIIIVFMAFDISVFTQNFWGKANTASVSEAGIFSQVKESMLVIVWVFIGIEGACVLSNRARRRSDIGKATFIGFLIVFSVLFLISLLPFGVFSQGEMMHLHAPSTGEILQRITGNLGKGLINISTIVSILGALLGWTLIAAEVPYIATTHDSLFPKVFGRVNSYNSPVGSLYITTFLQQLYLLFAYFNQAGYLKTLTFSTEMILMPYLFSAAYSCILVMTGETYKKDSAFVVLKNKIISVICLVYCIWVLYAAGLEFLLISSLLYAIGTSVYIFDRIHRKNKRIFKPAELVVAAIIIISASVAVKVLLVTPQ